MQNLIDFILRKVSECFLYMQVMNKNVLASASSQDQQQMEKDKQASNFRNYEYKKALMKQADTFWDETVSMGIPNLSKAVRWDIFEENIISLLLEKMNFNSDLLNKITWKVFLQEICDKIGEKNSESDEVPQPASNPQLLPAFKGIHIFKSKFSNFVAEDGIFLAL